MSKLRVTRSSVVDEIGSIDQFNRLIYGRIMAATASHNPSRDIFQLPDIVVARLHCEDDTSEQSQSESMAESYEQLAKLYYAPSRSDSPYLRTRTTVTFVNIHTCMVKELSVRYKLNALPAMIIAYHGDVVGKQSGIYYESDMHKFMNKYLGPNPRDNCSKLKILKPDVSKAQPPPNPVSNRYKNRDMEAGPIDDMVDGVLNGVGHFIGQIGNLAPQEFPPGYLGTAARLTCFGIDVACSIDHEKAIRQSRFRTPQKVAAPYEMKSMKSM